MPTRDTPPVIHPLLDRSISIDPRALLADAIERELATRCGGNAVLDRLEAEAWADALTRGVAEGSAA